MFQSLVWLLALAGAVGLPELQLLSNYNTRYIIIGRPGKPNNWAAGNRTRAARVAGEHSTTEPPMVMRKGHFWIKNEVKNVIISEICETPSEVFSDCGAACQPNCSNYETLRDCPDICVPGCVCSEGYVRKTDELSPCIKTDVLAAPCQETKRSKVTLSGFSGLQTNSSPLSFSMMSQRPLGKPQDNNRKAETMEPNGDRLNDLGNKQQQQHIYIENAQDIPSSSLAQTVKRGGKIDGCMFERFDENLENVENYIYRLKQFMLISKTKEDFKTPFLISSIGPKYSGILRNLVFPEEVDQVPFDKLCKILLKHFNPKTNIIFERFVFQKMDQKSGEGISKYIIRLKEQAQRCNFGDFLQESLRDRFVAGIIDTPTQKKLLQEEGLTFEGALDIALSAESADNDLHNLKRSEDAHRSPQHLHAINNPCKHCGRDFLNLFNNLLCFKNYLHKLDSFSIDSLLNDYGSIFECKSDPIKGIKCHLDVKADFIPKFYKFRQVPFALKQLVENEIDKLVDLNILSPIDKSDCASPLVCVAKPNGQIRLCADFKKSLNPYLEDVKYPIPNIDSVLSNFQGKKLFTKLDLSKAYHQIEMDDISKKKFTIYTDHKPLITIFGDKTNLPPLIANRLHRWALTLSNYSFEIKYKKGKDNIIPDFLSRFPECQEDNLEYNDGSGEILLLNTSIIDHVLVAHEIQLDRTLFKLYKIIETGELPSSPNDDLIPYLKRIDDFTILQECIFLENRMVIPKGLHERVLQILHESHAGTNKMKMMARSSIWWPGMDSSIEIITKNCRTCLSNESLPPQMTESWPKYAGPWRRVHMDYFNFKNKLFLLAVDSFSSWVEVSEVPSTSAYFCINFMRNCIAHYGFPQVVVSDNGPPFFSSDFGDFCLRMAYPM
ncbi:K02A2.6-like [Cordylochernes scorpioides]|uniref:RNA-directed DNA polymerase n=1 Tax=Cordylochernes scorpioides TaxID=51811 RepID=A0ABY6LCJ5_9ARAC|nr:K02A2.6-like [Cordylochernes scorpioides]